MPNIIISPISIDLGAKTPGFTFTFRVDEGLKDNFTVAAKSLDRSGALLLRD